MLRAWSGLRLRFTDRRRELMTLTFLRQVYDRESADDVSVCTSARTISYLEWSTSGRLTQALAFRSCEIGDDSSETVCDELAAYTGTAGALGIRNALLLFSTPAGVGTLTVALILAYVVASKLIIAAGSQQLYRQLNQALLSAKTPNREIRIACRAL